MEKYKLRFTYWKEDIFTEKFLEGSYPSFEAAWEVAIAIADALKSVIAPEKFVNDTRCGGRVSLSFAHMAVEMITIKVVEDGGADMQS